MAAVATTQKTTPTQEDVSAAFQGAIKFMVENDLFTNPVNPSKTGIFDISRLDGQNHWSASYTMQSGWVIEARFNGLSKTLSKFEVTHNGNPTETTPYDYRKLATLLGEVADGIHYFTGAELGTGNRELHFDSLEIVCNAFLNSMKQGDTYEHRLHNYELKLYKGSDDQVLFTAKAHDASRGWGETVYTGGVNSYGNLTHLMESTGGKAPTAISIQEPPLKLGILFESAANAIRVDSIPR